MRWTLFILLGVMVLPLLAQDEEEPAELTVTVLGLFADKAMLRIGETQRLLAVGQQSPEGVKLLAADSEQAVVEIDGKQRQLQLGTHISSHFSTPKVVKVRVWPDSNGMYSVNGTINGGSVGFLIDTGANTIALNANDAKRLHIDYKKRGKPVMGETASGRSLVYLLNLDLVTVGQIKLYNVEAIVFDGPHPSQALLGLTFLNRIQMNRDGSMLTLEQK